LFFFLVTRVTSADAVLDREVIGLTIWFGCCLSASHARGHAMVCV